MERWTPHELSFVTVPADPGAQVRAGQPATLRMFPIEFTNRGVPEQQENEAMPNEIVAGNAPR